MDRKIRLRVAIARSGKGDRAVITSKFRYSNGALEYGYIGAQDAVSQRRGKPLQGAHGDLERNPDLR